MKKGLKVTLLIIATIILLLIGFFVGKSRAGTYLTEIFVGTSTILEDPSATGDPEAY